jgi:hypothetical protein
LNAATQHFFLAAAILLIGSLLGVPVATAAPDASYARVSKLYSTMEGWYQAVELELVTVGSTPLLLGGRNLIVRDKYGNTRSTRSLPNQYDGPIQRPYLLLSSFAKDSWEIYSGGDIQLEPRLPIDGGTIEVEGMDKWTFGPLPLDGRHALARDGTVVPSILNRYLPDPYSNTAEYTANADFARSYAAEYYHAGMDHYFRTALASEMDVLDSGQIPGWKRIGIGSELKVFSRSVNSTAAPGSVPVCRFLKVYPDGYSHILSSVPAECLHLAETGFGTLESMSVFHVAAADPVTGSCPENVWVENAYGLSTTVVSRPVYRLWNGKAEANHRFVSGLAKRNEMVARGWIPEGYGPDGVAFCGDGE